ncbi:hypothetical protein [Paenarthrobacter sp. 22069]|uniref:hypothetical protein n=1 Tax=Paenarthrobacter sp. 22069 TaxID=3453864 RepID=UPI003F8672BE
MERRHDDAIRELHARYGRAAEQLAHSEVAVRLAGVYATAALADDWNFHADEDQGQACIDLLCSYFRITAGDEGRRNLDVPVREAIWSTIMSRLASDVPGSKSWAKVKFNLRQLDEGPSQLPPLFLGEGHLDLTGSRFTGGLLLMGGEQRGGSVILCDALVDKGEILVGRYRIFAGELRIGFNADSAKHILKLVEVELEGGALLLDKGTQHVQFIGCVFRGGEIDFSRAFGLRKVEFIQCEFASDVVRPSPGEAYRMTLDYAELLVTDCSFGEGVPALVSHPRENPDRPFRTMAVPRIHD